MRSILTTSGRREILDQTPISLPIRFNRQEPLHVRLQREVRRQIEEMKMESETQEDAIDFMPDEVVDIEDRLTAYQDDNDFEGHFLPTETSSGDSSSSQPVEKIDNVEVKNETSNP